MLKHTFSVHNLSQIGIRKRVFNYLYCSLLPFVNKRKKSLFSYVDICKPGMLFIFWGLSRGHIRAYSPWPPYCTPVRTVLKVPGKIILLYRSNISELGIKMWPICKKALKKAPDFSQLFQDDLGKIRRKLFSAAVVFIGSFRVIQQKFWPVSNIGKDQSHR